jgi:hypothetical protein
MIECKSESILDKVLREILLENYNKGASEGSTEEVFSLDENSSTFFKNGSTILLLQALFKNYNKSVKIVGTSLCNKILRDEECRRKLDIFESSVSIILTNSPNYMSDKIKNYFFNNLNSNAQIKETKSHLIYLIGKEEKEAEFLILDDIAYFLEHDLASGGKVARCNFNNPEGALHLSKQFDEFYNKY